MTIDDVMLGNDVLDAKADAVARARAETEGLNRKGS